MFVSANVAADDSIFLKYGEKIYIQSEAKEKLWLTGGRDNGNKDVRVNNVYTEKDKSPHYEWVMVAEHPNNKHKGKGSYYLNEDQIDIKKGECVKYGDRVFLYTVGDKFKGKRWMQGSRGKKQDGVWCLNVFDLGKDDRNVVKNGNAMWQVRSNPGTGEPHLGNNKDPNEGLCVQNLSEVYLQNYGDGERWLQGGIGGGDKNVGTNNLMGNKGNSPEYKWILRRDIGNGEIKGAAVICAPKVAKGVWQKKGSNTNGESQTITFTSGISK